MAPGLVLLLVTLLTLSYSASAQDTGYVVRLAQIVHDHGARSPPLTGQAATICGTDYPCGALSLQGMQMMAAVGDYVRTRYNNPDLTGTSFFPFAQYDQTLLASLAADYSYTIQSAEAFISGVFPASTSFYPVVLSANHSTDLRISTQGLPAAMLRRDVDTAELERVLDAVIDGYFTWAQLQSIASAVSASALCPSAAQRGSCVRALYEIYRYLEAAGTLSSYPALAQARDGLLATWVAYGRYLFAYDADEPLDVAQGSAGQPIAQQLIRRMQSYTAAATVTASYKLYEYSADAGLLSALGVTLGAGDDATFAPAFGSAYIVELLQGATDARYYVRVLRGSPVAQRAGAYLYQPSAFTQRCTAANGTTYVAASNVCALDDFVRYIATSKATATAGYCAVNETQYAMLQCPQSPSQPLPHFCALYRSVCPKVACPSGYVLSAADQRCYERANGGGGNYVVRLAQVLHRHGARNPTVTENVTQICGTEYPCGYLNAQGMKMLTAVGDFVRSRYRDPSIVESPLLPTDVYNASLVYSRSTYFPRTLQSASAFLHGLFPSNDSFFPAIFTVNVTTDVLLNSDPNPSVIVNRFVDIAGLQARFNPVVDALFTWDELQQAAEEAYWSAECQDVSMRFDCVYNLFDMATSFQATGRLADKPHLAAALPKLIKFIEAYWRYLLGYDPSDPIRRRQGSIMYGLGATLVANMRAHIVAPSYAMYHYSTHDTVAIPLTVTFGDQRNSSFYVPYGITFLVELLQDTDDGSYHVRILRGNPEETEPGKYSFVQTYFEQHCMDANGTTYIRDICPLDDFARFIDSSKPTDPAGFCALSTEQQALLACPSVTDSTTPLPQYCALYRIICPATSCPAGYDLNAADLRCYPVGSIAATTTSNTKTLDALNALTQNAKRVFSEIVLG